MRLSHWCVVVISTYLCALARTLPAEAAIHAVERSVHDAAETRQLEESQVEASLEKNKYFHEPGQDDILGHYDVRYFHGVVTFEERTMALRHMIRAYLLFFREKGIETWIAHGTLLGWWWNGKMLPWDWDIDTQVSGETLLYIATNFNGTLHHYVSDDRTARRKYLLDVNPWSSERDRGDGMNVIDARWIDVQNGLYIDITGLSETKPDIQPGVWSCKNYHRYHTKDLYPMRASFYEGVPVNIPYAYDKILIEEYEKKALVLTEYEGYYWDAEARDWLKKPEEEESSEHLTA